MRREQHTMQDSLHRERRVARRDDVRPAGRRVAQLALSVAQRPRGGQRRRGRLVALVLARPLEPGAVERLLLGVAGEHAEADRRRGGRARPGSARRWRRGRRSRSAGCRRGSPRRARRRRRTPAAASAAATTGSSKVPGTRTTRGRRPGGRRRRAAAPASRPSITSVCQLAATTATRRSLASNGSTAAAPSPLTGAPPRARGVQASRSGRTVAHPVPLGQQVGEVVVVGVRRQRDPLGDGDAVLLEVGDLVGVVGHQPDRADPEVLEDLGRGAVVAGVGRQAEVEVGVDGVAAAVLELVGLQLGDQPDPAALVAAQVDHHSPALGRRSCPSPR